MHNGNSMIKNVYQIQAQILKPERYFEHDHIKVIQIRSLLLLYLKHFFHCIVIFLSYYIINAKILHDKIGSYVIFRLLKQNCEWLKLDFFFYANEYCQLVETFDLKYNVQSKSSTRLSFLLSYVTIIDRATKDLSNVY